MSIYDIDIAGLDGGAKVLDKVKGKVSLVVNVASKCGLTPQYEAMQAIHERYASEGFSVVGVPCNQFLGQEPGTAAEIAEFCSTNYGVSFPLTEKIEVNGDGRHALYEELTKVADSEGESGDIRWNFEKFVVDRDGRIVARFHPKVAPDAPEVVAAIESAL